MVEFSDLFPEKKKITTEKKNNLSDSEENFYENFSKTYNFDKENKFINLQNPLKKLEYYLNKGNSNLVFEILEAHLQKNLQDWKGWRALGILCQELDSDENSSICFLNSLKYSKNHPSTFLKLGVSCTNIFNEIHAMGFLEKWLHNCDRFKNLDLGENIILISSENKLEKHYSTDLNKIENSEKYNEKMIEKFTNIEENLKQEDIELFYSLAILHFISTNYQKALSYFQKILKFDQNNYSIWNKIGATHAFLQNFEKAQKCYYKALYLKPNYIKCITNLAINYNSKEDYKNASIYLLNSIALNQKKENIWNYLESVLFLQKILKGLKK